MTDPVKTTVIGGIFAILAALAPEVWKMFHDIRFSWTSFGIIFAIGLSATALVVAVRHPDQGDGYTISGDTLICWGKQRVTGDGFRKDYEFKFPATFRAPPVITTSVERHAESLEDVLHWNESDRVVHTDGFATRWTPTVYGLQLDNGLKPERVSKEIFDVTYVAIGKPASK